MTIKIEKNVPIPSTLRPSLYPFEEMEVGDSFFVEGKTSNQLTNAASHWRKKMKWGFKSMNVVEGEVKGARIWRVK